MSGPRTAAPTNPLLAMATAIRKIDGRVGRMLALVILGLVQQPAHALDKPEGRVVLTVSGNVSQANSGKNAVFDMKMLEKLPQRSFSTQTPWYPGATTFTGPLLRDVLAAVGAKGTTLVAVALNDYKTEMPVDDAYKYEVIVARLMNDKPMPVREKGPLFIVFPFDSKPELRTELYYNRSAWQLNAIKVQ